MVDKVTIIEFQIQILISVQFFPGVYPEGLVVGGVATDCLLSLTTRAWPDGYVVQGVATDC